MLQVAASGLPEVTAAAEGGAARGEPVEISLELGVEGLGAHEAREYDLVSAVKDEVHGRSSVPRHRLQLWAGGRRCLDQETVFQAASFAPGERLVMRLGAEEGVPPEGAG